MITQVCGFKDEEGNFFDTSAEARISSMATKISKELYKNDRGCPWTPTKSQIEKILTVLSTQHDKCSIAELFNIQASDL